MTQFQYYPIFASFYNPFGSAPSTNTNSVTYNGTLETGGTPPNPSYSLVANETVSQGLLDIWGEFVLAYTAIATNTTNIGANSTAITVLQTALANLKTSASEYDGTVKTGGGSGNPTYSMTANEALNTILVSVWNEFVNVYSDIAGVSTGVSQTTLNNTMHNVVTDFATGIGYTSATGLVVTLASGSASIGGQYSVFAGGTITTVATKDNWLYVNQSGVLSLIAVTINASQPATVSGTIVLWKVTTGASSVTSHTDERNLTPFTATQIKNLYANSSIPLTAADSSWTDFLLPVTSSTGKALVSDGSDWIEGNIIYGTIGSPVAGNIRYTGGFFSGYNGAAWLVFATKSTQLTDFSNAAANANQVPSWDNGSSAYVPVAPANIPAPQSAVAIVAPTYNVLSSDYRILVDVTANAVNVILPNPTTNAGQSFYIVCVAGDIASHNITVTCTGGANIKGGTPTFTMATAYSDLLISSTGLKYTGIYG